MNESLSLNSSLAGKELRRGEEGRQNSRCKGMETMMIPRPQIGKNRSKILAELKVGRVD